MSVSSAGTVHESSAPGPPRPTGRLDRVRDTGRSAVRWGVLHGLPSLMIRAGARRGDLQAMMIRAASAGASPWEVIERIRAEGPLVGAPRSVISVDHAVVREILTSSSLRTGTPATMVTPLGRLALATRPPWLHPLEPPSLLATEPPEHTRYRKLVTRVFTARAVEGLRERTEQIADQLLDRLDEQRDPVDLVGQYCSLLPVAVIAEILGVPASEHLRVLDLGDRAASSLDFGVGWRRYRTTERGLRDFDAWLGRHLDRLRHEPGDDLLSQLVHACDEEGRLTPQELRATAGLVLAAGFETTVNLLGNGIRLLHDHPDQLRLALGDPALWPNVVDEVLRMDPPVLITGRVAAEEVRIAGRPLPTGAFASTVLAGANRDPAVFAEPATFDVARANARDHLSFSSGRHYCLGACLARMEGAVGLQSFFERFGGVRLLDGAERRRTRVLRGWATLPARLR